MATSVIDRLEADRDRLVQRFCTMLREHVPRYTTIRNEELTASVQDYLSVLLQMLRASDQAPLAELVHRHVARRAAQGLSPGDFLRAALLTQTVIRKHIFDALPDRPVETQVELDEVFDALNTISLVATEAFLSEATRRLEGKQKSLLRMTEELEAHKRALSVEVRTATAQLASHRSLTRKILESLSSGVIAVDSRTDTVTLCSERAGQIFERSPESVIGMSVHDAARGIKGVSAKEMVETVAAYGRYPLRKVALSLEDGRKKWLFISAERLYGEEGEPEGTVVIIDDVTEREVLIDSFSRYVSRDLVDRVLAGGGAELGGEKRVVTVLFADIRGFSGIAERVSPEQLHDLLNIYFSVMIDAITFHGGFIDKFVGDNVMALFGTEGPSEQGATAAVRAAATAKRAIAALNEVRKTEGKAAIAVGLGINTGEVVLGTIGSKTRMSFTAIGDAVNIADRLQGLARQAEVLVGEGTHALLPTTWPLTDLGDTAVRGRIGEVRHYALDWERLSEE